MQFREPTNQEESPIKRERNLAEFANLLSEILNKSGDSTIVKLTLLGREKDHHYRRPGGIPAQWGEPDSSPSPDRADFCGRASAHRPPGPGHYHGG